ncbi:MAG: stress response translation initiation inhibitor YciH [archaeon]
MDICPNCGLPKDACICSELHKTQEKIKITKVTRRFGKPVTVVEGITENTKEIAKKLKAVLACGGTVKKDTIELQGNHLGKVKEKLIALGFKEDNIRE